MDKHEHRVIKQIIPAQAGYLVVYANYSDKSMFTADVVAWGLVSDGKCFGCEVLESSVVALVLDSEVCALSRPGDNSLGILAPGEELESFRDAANAYFVSEEIARPKREAARRAYVLAKSLVK